jgi:parallel beta-helix repeat protein
VRGNFVSRARAADGDEDAAGIYVDGGQNVIVENNTVTACDYGIEVGAENRGVVASGVVVRNNVLFKNRKAGLIFGGFERRRGRVVGCRFVHNVLFRNDTSDSGDGQLVVQFAEDNVVAGNVMVASGNGVLWTSERGGKRNLFDYNLYFTRGGANDLTFRVNGREFFELSRYQRRTGLDAHSRFGDPGFADGLGGDFRVGLNSPAIDAGSPDPNQSAATDFNGQLRPLGLAPDAGVFEVR